MEPTDEKPNIDKDKLVETINENRQRAAESLAPSRKRAFFTLGLPRFRGLKLGIGIGLLVVALAAGLAELYNIFWNSTPGAYTDGTTFLGEAAMVLYAVLAIGSLGLASIALPLMLVWGKGKRRAAVTFAVEFIVIGIALGLAFAGIYSRSDHDQRFCNAGGGAAISPDFTVPASCCVECPVNMGG